MAAWISSANRKIRIEWIWTFQRTINRHSIYLVAQSKSLSRLLFSYFSFISINFVALESSTTGQIRKSSAFACDPISKVWQMNRNFNYLKSINLWWVKMSIVYVCDEQNWCYWWQPVIRLKNEVETVYSFEKWIVFASLKNITCAKTKQINLNQQITKWLIWYMLSHSLFLAINVFINVFRWCQKLKEYDWNALQFILYIFSTILFFNDHLRVKASDRVIVRDFKCR